MDFKQFAAGSLAAGNFAFGNFATARDLLYLAALFFGAGLGCMLNRFRRIHNSGRSAERFRNVTVTAGLCFFSVTVVALTVASIISNWMIFRESALYVPLGILALILVLAVRFPRAAGFPLILVAGVFVVWMGYAFLRFPVTGASGFGSVSRLADGSVRVKLPSAAAQNDKPPLVIRPEKEDTVLEFRALDISVSRYFPLAGGVSRGGITEIRTGSGKTLYANPALGRDFFPVRYIRAFVGPGEVPGRFILFQELPGKLEIKNLLPAKDLIILGTDAALAFQ
ncbi:MAG: hypothetical protein FWC45_00360 [Treponema sp.]|nr:hypothetical protein [Treponema sp.]